MTGKRFVVLRINGPTLNPWVVAERRNGLTKYLSAHASMQEAQRAAGMLKEDPRYTASASGRLHIR